jgi:hypothetical protein
MIGGLCLACGLAWGTVPDQIVALTAVVSAFLVVSQLTGLRSDRQRAENTMNLQLDQFRSEAESARANLLLRIDEQFEGVSVLRSRVRWLELRAIYRREHVALEVASGPRDRFVEIAMIGKLDMLWDRMQGHVRGEHSFPANVRGHNIVMRLPNWIETIGMVARKWLLPVSDVIKLYGSVIETTMKLVSGHIEHRRKDATASITVFENALWPYALAKAVAPPRKGQLT